MDSSDHEECVICAADLRDPCNAGRLSEHGWVCKSKHGRPTDCELVLRATAQ